MAFNGFAGTRMGFIQSTYNDQMGVALPGMLMFANDDNLIDSLPVGETEGVKAGKGVRVIAGDEVYNYQRPPQVVYLPEGDEAVAEFAGVVVFDHGMRSDASGNPGWNKYDFAQILRKGRIYVAVKDSIVPGTSTVNLVIAVDQAGKYELGDFCPTALGGTTAGTSVAITCARWVTPETTSGLAGIEIWGNVLPSISTTA